MFDDIKKEPEDMFEATDKVVPQVTPPTDKPIQAAAPAIPSAPNAKTPSVQAMASKAQSEQGGSSSDLEERIAQASLKRGSFPWKTIILIIGIIAIVGAAFFISLKILSSRAHVTPEPPTTATNIKKAAGEEAEAGQKPVNEQPVTNKRPEENSVSNKDTDKDGLTDEEEQAYGTSPLAADTDSDGLFDAEEINVWDTNPLNPDTDGDGYLDGEEVSAGYNPNGEGELREIPTDSN